MVFVGYGLRLEGIDAAALASDSPRVLAPGPGVRLERGEADASIEEAGAVAVAAQGEARAEFARTVAGDERVSLRSQRWRCVAVVERADEVADRGARCPACALAGVRRAAHVIEHRLAVGAGRHRVREKHRLHVGRRCFVGDLRDAFASGRNRVRVRHLVRLLSSAGLYVRRGQKVSLFLSLFASYCRNARLRKGIGAQTFLRLCRRVAQLERTAAVSGWRSGASREVGKHGPASREVGKNARLRGPGTRKRLSVCECWG
jgi:hypothetical protein